MSCSIFVIGTSSPLVMGLTSHRTVRFADPPGWLLLAPWIDHQATQPRAVQTWHRVLQDPTNVEKDTRAICQIGPTTNRACRCGGSTKGRARHHSRACPR